MELFVILCIITVKLSTFLASLDVILVCEGGLGVLLFSFIFEKLKARKIVHRINTETLDEYTLDKSVNEFATSAAGANTLMYFAWVVIFYSLHSLMENGYAGVLAHVTQTCGIIFLFLMSSILYDESMVEWTRTFMPLKRRLERIDKLKATGVVITGRNGVSILLDHEL